MTEPADEAPFADELRRRRHWLKQRVGDAPHDLDLRHELVAVYRAEGNISQAGRWDYLSESADPRETSAFAHAFQDDPIALMRALRWTGSEDDAATEVARERLRLLRERARDRVGHAVSWEDPEAGRFHGWGGTLGCLGVALLVVLVVVGAVTVVRWIASLM